jgi:hypothetical protein
LLAYRLLLRKGEWDVDCFFRSIPASKWAELKVAHALIESQDDWWESKKWGNKAPWTPPDFGPVEQAKGVKAKKKGRRRLSGAEY